MSELHEAVARAIRDELGMQAELADADVLAAVAVRVVLAEATRSIEALPEGLRKGDVRLADVLAVFDARVDA